MANALYPLTAAKLWQAGVNLSTGAVKCVIVDTAGGTNYAYSAAHEFLSDVVAGSRRATSPALTSKTFTNGTFDAADIVNAFPSLSGGAIEAAIFYIDSGVEATSPLLFYFDTSGGLPFTPTGNNTDLNFNAAGIASL